MATTIATVSYDGQLVLPAEIQRMLGIPPGSSVEIAVHGQQIEITPRGDAPMDGEAAKKAIQELRGMSAGQPSLEEEYSRDWEKSREVVEVERLIEAMCGMFEGGPSMTDELLRERREEELRSTW